MQKGKYYISLETLWSHEWILRMRVSNLFCYKSQIKCLNIIKSMSPCNFDSHSGSQLNQWILHHFSIVLAIICLSWHLVNHNKVINIIPKKKAPRSLKPTYYIIWNNFNHNFDMNLSSCWISISFSTCNFYVPRLPIYYNKSPPPSFRYP